jgi:cytochrome c-type biogenesis protein CcmH/NrfF
MLIYRCPTTTRVVHSSIVASETEMQRLSELKLSLGCPYCQLGHAILGKDTQVVADVMPSAA